MLVVNGHRLDHDASSAPAPIRRLDRIRDDHGRVVAKLELMTEVIRERKRLTVNVPPDPPKGGSKGADGPSNPAPNVVGGPVELDPGRTERLNQQLTVNPLLPNGQGQVLDRSDVSGKPRITGTIFALSDNEHEVDILAAPFSRQRPRDKRASPCQRRRRTAHGVA